MSDCLQIASSGVFQFGVSANSSVFDAVRGMIDISAEMGSEIFITPPDFDNIDLNVPIAGTGAAALEDPQYSARTVPSASLTGPQLESAAYNAVVSLIDLGHTSPTLSDITYRSGLDHVQVPNHRPPPPPLNYPQEGLQSLPRAPALRLIPLPSMDPGEQPDMDPIAPIHFTPSGLEPLGAGELPEYDEPDVEIMPWQDELQYHGDAELRTKLEAIMAGDDEAGRWISDVVQHTLYKRDIRGLALKTKTEMDEALTRAAGRNFSMPVGMVDAAVARAARSELEDSQDVAEKVTDEVYAAAMELVTQAVSRSLQVEQYHFKLYMRYVRQNLRVYQRNIELATELYNQLVGVYGRIVSAIRTRIEAYNQYIRAMSAENRALASQIELREAEIQTYQAKIMMFGADASLRQKAAQLLRSEVEQQTFPLALYQADIKGHMANLRIIEQNLQGFQQAIGAYSRNFEWYDDAIGAFESATEAATSKVAVNSNKFDSYRELWGAEQDRASAFERYLSSSFSVMDDEMRNFRQAASVQQSYLTSVRQSLDASLQAVSAHAGVTSDIGQHAGDYNSANIGYTAASDSVNVSQETMAMSQQAIDAEATAQYARLDAAKRSARLTAAGALAQAASSIFQVSVSADGQASERVSGRAAGSTRFSAQERKQFSKQCVEVKRPAKG